MRVKSELFFVLLTGSCLFSLAGADTYLVKTDGSGDYPTTQAAIDAAIDGDVVMLDPGVYTGLGNRDIDFKGKAITVRGSTGNPEDCVIDCQASGYRRGFYFHSAESSRSRLEFLTITNGHNSGGAIYLTYSSPTINCCIFDDNGAPYYGAGIYMDGSNSLISGCVFSNNQTSSYGGALYCSSGSPTIINCAFVGNASNYGDGTLYFQGGSPTLRNCTINNNYGVYNDCSGIYSANSHCIIKNCIIWNNTIWFNEFAPQIFTSGTAVPTVSYSCIQSSYAGTGNTSSNPRFITYGGYLLNSDSPCIDRGDLGTAVLPGETDIEGDPRKLGRIDMGADETIPENQPVLYLPETTFHFRAGKGSAVDGQTFEIHNSGTLPFDWSIAENCDWLVIDRLSGQTESLGTTAVGLDIDHAGMDYGVYSYQFDITADTAAYSPQTVTVTLEILGPELGVSSNLLGFTAGGLNDIPDAQLLAVENTGFDMLHWTITEPNVCGWLEVSLVSGQTPRDVPTEVSVLVDPAAAGYGEHMCDLLIRDPNAANSPQVVTVTLDVLRPKISISYSTPALGFECDVDEPNGLSQTLSISNSGYDTLNWEISEDCDWLSVSPISGQCISGPNEVTLTVNPAGLDIGFYNSELTITDENASNSPVTVPVSLHIYRDGQRHVPTEYPTIEQAIHAAVDGDHIVVHPGVHYTFHLNRSGFLGKAITVRSIEPDNPAIVDSTLWLCDEGLSFMNNEGPDTVLDGFTFSGPIGVINASPTIRNCKFVRDGFYPQKAFCFIGITGGSPQIVGCSFIAAGYAPPGLPPINIVGNNRNMADPIRIVNCLLSVKFYSTTDGRFGAMSISDSHVEMVNTTIAECFTDTRFWSPTGVSAGHGLRIQESDVIIKNSIIWGNRGDGDSQIVIINHSSDPNDALNSNVSISYSNVEGGEQTILLLSDMNAYYDYLSTVILPDPNLIAPDTLIWGLGNMNADPLFVREPNDGGDGWFAIDIPGAVYDPAPIYNNDYGDLHLKSQAGRFVWEGFARADFNLDKRVDLVDFSGMAQKWLMSASSPHTLYPYNLNGDVTVDLKDLIFLCDDYLQPRVCGAWVTDDVTSPCIDAGDLNDAGWQNELWPHGGRINMGAYGGTPQASLSPNTTGNPADLNHDNTVDYTDWALWSDDWRDERVLLDSDFDRNNVVDPNDLDLFLNHWLWSNN